MVSPVFNVLRWAALASGVVYGFAHDRTLASEADEKRKHAAFEKKAKLIEEAKAEWVKLHPKPQAPAASGPAEADFDDPKFDIVKFIDASIEGLKN